VQENHVSTQNGTNKKAMQRKHKLFRRLKNALQLLLILKPYAAFDMFNIAIWYYVNDEKINEAKRDIIPQVFD
jgi:hypothetical protein